MALFGEALRDYYHHKQKGALCICDETGEYSLNLAYYLDIRLEKHEIELLKYAKGKILDVGCGAGRAMRYLLQKGLEVVGFDIDEILIDLCKEQGLQNVYHESYEKMEKFGTFGTIILLNRNLGIAGNLKGLKRLLDKCYECCNPGGLLIFDSLEIRLEEPDRTRGYMEKKLRMKYNEIYGKWFPWIHIGGEVMEALIMKSGWKREEIIRSGDCYGMVCRKIDIREHNNPTGKVQ